MENVLYIMVSLNVILFFDWLNQSRASIEVTKLEINDQDIDDIDWYQIVVLQQS